MVEVPLDFVCIVAMIGFLLVTKYLESLLYYRELDAHQNRPEKSKNSYARPSLPTHHLGLFRLNRLVHSESRTASRRKRR